MGGGLAAIGLSSLTSVPSGLTCVMHCGFSVAWPSAADNFNRAAHTLEQACALARPARIHEPRVRRHGWRSCGDAALK